jgi:uncharacterized protein (DUF1800 family)
MIMRSAHFFSPEVRRRRVKSPVELTIGTLRALEVLKPTLPANALAEACRQMGPSLYAPPSVAGWDQGPGWINTATSLARANFALGLIEGGRFDAERLAKRHGEDPVGFYGTLLLQGEVSGSNAVEAARAALTAPEYQLA